MRDSVPASAPDAHTRLPIAPIAHIAPILQSASFCFALLLLATASASAHEGPHGPALDDAERLEIFMDGVVNTVMYQRRIPGAVVAVVKDGRVLMNKGYGYANAETKAPVSPDSTLFRIASVTKTVNATAVMQLVEQGKFDLNDEVNALLERYNAPLRIAEHYPTKVRLLDLINHTAGFDERAIGMSRLAISDVPALGAYLAARMPPQVMEPRSTISYSNHGVALAGYLVELASGEPYNAYVRDHIYIPAGMTHSSMEWNDTIAPNIAQGYQVPGGQLKPVPFDHICIPPAGGMLSSGADMARFMIMHLQKGQIDLVRILQENSIDEMHSEQYSQDPRLNAWMAVGFFRGTRNGHRFLEHGGDLNGFASRIFLLPDDGVGIFTSCNVDDDALRGAIVGQFMDRYFAEPDKTDPAADLDLAQRIKDRCAGSYRSNRFARHSIEKLQTLVAQTRVTVDDKGNVSVAGSSGDPKRYAATHPDVITDVRTGNAAVFRLGNDGNATHLLTGEGALERLEWYEEQRWQYLFIGAMLLISASAVVCWPAAYIWRRRRTNAARRAPACYRVTAWALAALALFLLVVLGQTLLTLDQWEFTYGMPERIIYLLFLPPVLSLGAALLAVNVLAIWWRGYWSGWVRLHYTLVAVACAGLVPFFLYWNLLGFNW
ncbi:MAG: beta-lactamase family protein [Candidatus Hydrogenedentes bacterium]|nr:beta-lactamase family protein [Candidatus Hydrogenedentota bacterium]